MSENGNLNEPFVYYLGLIQSNRTFFLPSVGNINKLLFLSAEVPFFLHLEQPEAETKSD